MSQPEVAQQGCLQACGWAQGAQAAALPWWPLPGLTSWHGRAPTEEYPCAQSLQTISKCYLTLALCYPCEGGRATTHFAGEETEAPRESGPAQRPSMQGPD